MEDWMNFAVSILSGIAVCLPLACKLVKVVRDVVKAGNWPKLLKMVMEYMEAAEEMFDSGSDKKEWVIGMVKASSDMLDFDINYDVVGSMIDALCGMSKVVNCVNEQEAAENV